MEGSWNDIINKLDVVKILVTSVFILKHINFLEFILEHTDFVDNLIPYT